MSDDEDKRRNIAELLAMSDNELFRRFAEEQGGEQAFPGDFVRSGKLAYARLKSNAQGKICNHEGIRKAVQDQRTNDRIMLVMVVGDLLGGKGAFTFGALLVKEGVATFCDAIWKPK